MEIKVQKWGNSFGIRIPSSIMKSLNLKNNDLLLLEELEDRIIITKSKNKKISLSERFKEYKGPNLCDDFCWDEPRGKEIW